MEPQFSTDDGSVSDWFKQALSPLMSLLFNYVVPIFSNKSGSDIVRAVIGQLMHTANDKSWTKIKCCGQWTGEMENKLVELCEWCLLFPATFSFTSYIFTSCSFLYLYKRPAPSYFLSRDILCLYVRKAPSLPFYRVHTFLWGNTRDYVKTTDA